MTALSGFSTRLTIIWKPNGDELDDSYPETGALVLDGLMSEDDEDSDVEEDTDPGEPALGSLDGRQRDGWPGTGRISSSTWPNPALATLTDCWSRSGNRTGKEHVAG